MKLIIGPIGKNTPNFPFVLCVWMTITCTCMQCNELYAKDQTLPDKCKSNIKGKARQRGTSVNIGKYKHLNLLGQTSLSIIYIA